MEKWLTVDKIAQLISKTTRRVQQISNVKDGPTGVMRFAGAKSGAITSKTCLKTSRRPTQPACKCLLKPFKTS
jgi:hypothetical protein